MFTMKLRRWPTILVALAVVGLQSPAPAAAPQDEAPPRVPVVLTPEEARTAVALTAVRAYTFDNKLESILTLKEASPATPPAPTGGAHARYVTEWVDLDKFAKQPGTRPAEQAYPIRLVILACGFPLKRQVEEFRQKLGKKTSAEVLDEATPAPGAADQSSPSFQFLGVDLQRRTFDPAAQREAAGYAPIDLKGVWEPLSFLTGKRSQPESPALAPVLFPGLVMPRPIAFRDDAYPPVEANLTTLKKSLEALHGKNPAAPKGTLPDHCLLRVIDPTVELGRTYEYRLRVRMRNPLHARKDVAKADAQEEEIVSEWYTVPQKVVMPPEVVIYAVDQRRLDGVADKEPPDAAHATLQIHRWMDYAKLRSPSEIPVGEWAVAERVLVARGEPVNQNQPVEMPYWRTTDAAFVLAIVTGGSPEKHETLLVDFTAGVQTYQRSLPDGGRPNEVIDPTPVQVLLLSPEGKLLARNAAADARDVVRITRLKAWRDRIAEVKGDKKAGDKSNGNDSR